jgi:hypothetical protein
MPQKKASELAQDAAECVLKIGKNNNVVQWKEAMQTELTAQQFGLVGMFFTTNERDVQPFPREDDYIPEFPESDDEDEEAAVLVDAEGEQLPAVEIAAQAVAREAAAQARRDVKLRAREKLILKLREGAYEKSDGNSKSERTYGLPYDVQKNEPGIAK